MKKLKRRYEYVKKGKKIPVVITYDVMTSPEGKVLKIFNEFHHSIKEGSECFNYLKRKYELEILAEKAQNKQDGRTVGSVSG